MEAGLEKQLQEVGQVPEQVEEEVQQLGAESLQEVGAGSRLQWVGRGKGEGPGLVSEALSDD